MPDLDQSALEAELAALRAENASLKEQLAHNQEELDERAGELVKQIRIGQSQFDSESFLSSLVVHMGGVDAFAEQVANDLRDNKLPATARVQLYKMIGGFIEHWTHLQLEQGKLNLEDTADEDLKVMASNIMEGIENRHVRLKGNRKT